MTLSSKDFQEKIDQVNKDLIKIQSEAGNDRKVDALNLYIDYLKDTYLDLLNRRDSKKKL